MSKQQQVEEQAFNYHNGGYHCAEAICKTIMEFYCQEQSPIIPQIASAFGGGVGQSHSDMCGALSGALLGLGLVRGRSQAGVDWKDLAGKARLLREQFIGEFGSSNCADILASLGEQENMMKCKRLSGKTAGLVAAIIETH